MKTYVYGILTGIVIALVAAYFWQRGRVVEGETRLVYKRDKEPPRLSVPALLPVTRTLYRTRVDTVRVSVPVPVDLGRIRGVLGVDPVRVSRRAFTVRYWSPDSLRWIADTYVLRPPRWGIWIDAAAGWQGYVGFYTGAHLNLRYNNWIAYAGYAVTQAEGSHALSFGLRRRLLGFY